MCCDVHRLSRIVRSLVARASEAAGESVLHRLQLREGKRTQATRRAQEVREEVRRQEVMEEEEETQALVAVTTASLPSS